MEIVIIAIFLTLGIVGILIPLFDQVIYSRSGRHLAGYIALISQLFSALLLGWTIWANVPITTSFGNLISPDELGIFFAIVFLLVGILITIASINFMHDDPNQGSYYALILLAVLGSILVGFSIDLVMLDVAWDLMFVTTLVLTGIRKTDWRSSEAAFKYYILGALSTAFVFLAIAFFIGITGTTSLAGIAAALPGISLEMQPLLLLAIVFTIIGFGIKMAIVPFQFWIPDAYEGAPTPIGGFLAAGSKKAGFAAILRVLTIVLITAPVMIIARWSFAIAFLAAITMTVGNIAALTQKSFPRMLAYSSIAHAGYMLIGIAYPNTVYSTPGLLFHILNHAIMTGAAFIAAAGVSLALNRTSVADYDGLGKTMPATAFILTLTLFGLAGIPPLNGFWSKAILFLAAIEAGALWLAIVMVLNSVFSLGYYSWIIKRMYLDEPTFSARVIEPRGILVALVIAGALILMIGIYPTPFLTWINGITGIIP
ncbi:MAG: NADH-quinone oxidoreductase subunit N [Candidatus Hodarchaeota archaeon]